MKGIDELLGVTWSCFLVLQQSILVLRDLTLFGYGIPFFPNAKTSSVAQFKWKRFCTFQTIGSRIESSTLLAPLG